MSQSTPDDNLASRRRTTATDCVSPSRVVSKTEAERESAHTEYEQRTGQRVLAQRDPRCRDHVTSIEAVAAGWWPEDDTTASQSTGVPPTNPGVQTSLRDRFGFALFLGLAIGYGRR